MAWDTAANVISDAAILAGIKSAAMSDPYASQDANVLQMCALLKTLGQRLLRDYAWSHLQKEHTFSTASTDADYALPSDFFRYVEGTGWNRTQQLPLVGPVNAKQWQAFKARTTSGAVGKVFRVWQDQMWLHPTPTSADTIAFEYISKLWVAATGGAAPSKEGPTVNSDELWLDRTVLVWGLVLDFKGAKGFDTTDAQNKFNAAIAAAHGADAHAPALSLTGGGLDVDRMLDDANVSDTGYGS